MGPAGGGYAEPGASWRPFWLVAGALGLLVVGDQLLPALAVPSPVWALVLLAVLGVVGAGVLSARRAWGVRVDAEGADPALTVGRERVLLADVDAAHLRAVGAGTAGVDAGAPVLGGGWSVPRGRAGLPLRLADGRTVLVPTRDPGALTTALLTAVRDTPEGHTGTKGTLGS
ncbi:hypothetical protein [Geodermatophilus sabuli]|uniref:DUF3093 domain-containing protein n=1 Tax=Geodermatophilus sabuli TaxID=1564158 RepID=A0A285EC19_9ACTN|nr:hypothetical protein [Geodermatophilus sabuli]MBB3084991.1 hypothetical protein [Geodermatophilus sabuli]SNX95601.1 hypothetical protein SAMN06893097_102301 [Geodermatophilus sabuli]